MLLKFLNLLFIISIVGCGGGSSNKKNSKQDSSGEKTSQEIAKLKPLKILLPREHISLTVGSKEKLEMADGKEVVWSSNNPAVTIDQNGYIYAEKDYLGEDAQAIISATPKDGGEAITCQVTIVNWRANLSSLSIEATPEGISELITNDNGTLYFSAGPTLLSSTDGMKSRQEVGSFPSAEEQTPILIKTPYSHYLRVDNRIFQSDNLTSYAEVLMSTETNLDHATEHPGLNHAFAYSPKGAAGGYLYAGEYTTNRDNGHSVYRGTISATGAISQWKKILEFDPMNSDTPSSVLHIHVVTVDPYTGDVWVGTGDDDSHSRLYYSQDNGETFKLFAVGSQYYRILSMWFTKDYIYWNTDSDEVKQVISRIKRTDHSSRGELTPRLSNGEQTKQGVRYYVFEAESDSLSALKGAIYTEDEAKTLGENDILYAIDDPAYDYREVVAELASGSHWYHAWVTDSKGEELVIMSTSAEGIPSIKRDNRARMIGIKERSNGTVDVQELLSISSPNSGPSSYYVQLTAGFQDDDGYIYFRGRETKHNIYKTKLRWIDQ